MSENKSVFKSFYMSAYTEEQLEKLALHYKENRSRVVTRLITEKIAELKINETGGGDAGLEPHTPA